ncbi:hypothetical protein VTJ04DRAFT_10224 [Mycothermus thermophilus]|uniref:uncharacterized protein n=1 Tax=Humicola insolens TaxID=85995 RepID=UPI0037430495
MNSAVKRKFNALIQGLGQQPATDRDTTTTTDHDITTSTSPHLRRSLSTSRLSTMAADSTLDILNKKRRVAGATTGLTSTPTKPTTTGGGFLASSPASIRSVPPSTTTISNVTLRRWTPGATTSSSSATTTSKPNLADNTDGRPPPPKYCPTDRDQLLRRLATFQELTDWAPKPERVSEIEWAKRGWTCVGKERVRCALCARELAVKVNRREEPDGREVSVLIASEIAESVVERYRELIVEGHSEECLWRRKGCDDSLLRLPLPNPRLALQGLRQRYDELCERAVFLPEEGRIRLPEGVVLDKVIEWLPEDFFTNPSPLTTSTTTTTTSTQTQPDSSTPINRSALALALLGWQGLTHPQLHTPVPNSASCHTCLRRLGLWMFRPRDDSSPSSRTTGAPLMDHLDPVREHRFFCPWKNPAAQRNPAARTGGTATTAATGSTGTTTTGAADQKDMAAWEVLVAGLRNEAFIRDKTSAAGGSKKKMGSLAGHGRSKSSAPAPGHEGGDGTAATAPSTPVRRRPTTAGAAAGGGELGDGEQGADGEEEDEETRRKKEMDMMSRLRRVKSLFNAKTAGGKLRKLGSVSGSSRPGTAHSSAAGGE